jgi:hypothetical protein
MEVVFSDDDDGNVSACRAAHNQWCTATCTSDESAGHRARASSPAVARVRARCTVLCVMALCREPVDRVTRRVHVPRSPVARKPPPARPGPLARIAAVASPARGGFAALARDGAEGRNESDAAVARAAAWAPLVGHPPPPAPRARKLFLLPPGRGRGRGRGSRQ